MTAAVRRRVRASLAVLALVLAACGPSEAEERADLCRDLASFGATFTLLLEPPSDARVGVVRGALEKVAPFLERLRAVEATDDELDDELEAVEESYRDALEGIGDDEPVPVLLPRMGSSADRLGDVLDGAASAIGCASPTP